MALIVSTGSDGTGWQADPVIDQQALARTNDVRFSVGIYAISAVANYVGVARSTLGGWINPPKDGQPLVTSLPRRGEHFPVPFVGFVEAFVLRAARLAGIPRRTLRRGTNAVAKTLGIPHPLASSALTSSDTLALFASAAAGRADVDDVADVAAALRERLRAIDYAEDGYAARIRLQRYAPAHVIVDPSVAFGLPTIAAAGPRVKDVLDRLRAGDDPDSVAYDFALSHSTIDAIVRAADASPRARSRRR